MSGLFDRIARMLHGTDAASTDPWALWSAARAGDAASARALVERLAPRALALARQVLRDPAEAEDIVQESLLRLWRSDADARHGSALSTYFHTIVLNRCRSRLRARIDEPTDQDALDTMLERAQDDARDDAPAFESLALTRADAQARLQAAMALLPARQRLAIAMWAYADADVDDIARALALTPNAAHQLLHRARRKLRASFED